MLESVLVEHFSASVDLTCFNERELIERISAAPAGGAPEEEAELYRRLAPRVRLYGVKHLRDDEAAADLAQHVLLITLQALRQGRVRDPDKLPSFVLGTCRMAVLDIRRGALRRERLLEQFARELPRVTALPAVEIDLDRLAHCMERLPERERTVLVLTFYDDQTGEEVATFLGLSQSNVRVIRHRGLTRLRTCMGGAR